MKRAQRWALGAIAVAALAGAGAFLKGPARPTLALRFGPEAGERYTYHLRLETKGEARSAVFGSASEGFGELSPFRFSVEGDVRWTALGSSQVLVELLDVKAESEGPPAARAAVPRLSSSRFVLAVNGAGRVERVDTPQTYGIVERNVARSVASFLETVGGSEPANTWTTEQSTPEGTVKATYVALRVTKTEATLRREERADEATASALGSGRARKREVRGHCTERVAVPSSVPLALSCERSDTRKLGDAVLARQTTTFAFDERGREVLSPEALASLRGELAESAVETTTVDARAELAAQDRRALERFAATHPLDRYLQTASTGAKDADLARVLDAHLAVSPASAAVVGAALERLGHDKPAFHAFASALARAGTEPSQRALLHASEAPGVETKARILLTVHEGMAQHPTPVLEEGLRRAAARSDDTRATAELALGNVARRLRDDAPARGDAILREMESRYRSAKSVTDREHYLRVLGNTGSEALPGIVGSALSDPREEVRRAAAQALRGVGTDEACSGLSMLLRTDPSPSVRAASIDALPGDVGAACDVPAILEPVLNEEREELVVRAALEKLAANASHEPRALRALEAYRETCGLASLCRTAKILLSTVRGS